MSLVRVESFAISLDGFGAGPDQDLANPLGVGGMALHGWSHPTATFKRVVFGQEGGSTGVDDSFAQRGFRNVGAWILGRNMFGPVRGPWMDDSWKGWWGDTPPYQVHVYVLTHHPRATIEMNGGTTFHFITGGIHDALAAARTAAGERDVRLGGGVSVIRQYLAARLIDELHLAVSPVMLGRGEALFAGLDLPALGYQVASVTPGEGATHLILRRAGAA